MKKEIIGWVTEILHFRISPFPTNCRVPPFTPNMNKFSQVHGKPILLSYASKQIIEKDLQGAILHFSCLWHYIKDNLFQLGSWGKERLPSSRKGFWKAREGTVSRGATGYKRTCLLLWPERSSGSKGCVFKAAAQGLAHENQWIKAMTSDKKQYALLKECLKINYSLFLFKGKAECTLLEFD